MLNKSAVAVIALVAVAQARRGNNSTSTAEGEAMSTRSSSRSNFNTGNSTVSVKSQVVETNQVMQNGALMSNFTMEQKMYQGSSQENSAGLMNIRQKVMDYIYYSVLVGQGST